MEMREVVKLFRTEDGFIYLLCFFNSLIHGLRSCWRWHVSESAKLVRNIQPPNSRAVPKTSTETVDLEGLCTIRTSFVQSKPRYVCLTTDQYHLHAFTPSHHSQQRCNPSFSPTPSSSPPPRYLSSAPQAAYNVPYLSPSNAVVYPQTFHPPYPNSSAYFLSLHLPFAAPPASLSPSSWATHYRTALGPLLLFVQSLPRLRATASSSPFPTLRTFQTSKSATGVPQWYR